MPDGNDPSLNDDKIQKMLDSKTPPPLSDEARKALLQAKENNVHDIRDIETSPEIKAELFNKLKSDPNLAYKTEIADEEYDLLLKNKNQLSPECAQALEQGKINAILDIKKLKK